MKQLDIYDSFIVKGAKTMKKKKVIIIVGIILLLLLLVILYFSLSSTDGKNMSKNSKQTEEKVKKESIKDEKTELKEQKTEEKTDSGEKNEDEQKNNNTSNNTTSSTKSDTTNSTKSSTNNSTSNTSNNQTSTSSNSSSNTSPPVSETPAQETPVIPQTPQTEWEKLGITKEEYENTPITVGDEIAFKADSSKCDEEISRLVSLYYRQGLSGGNSYDIIGKYTHSYIGCGINLNINGTAYTYSEAKQMGFE